MEHVEDRGQSFKNELTGVPWPLLALFIVLVAGIVIGGYLYFRDQRGKIVAEVNQDLALIADLKVAEINHWRVERLYDAEAIFNNPFLSSHVEQYFKKGESDATIKKELIRWMSATHNIHDYEGMLILDAKGRIRLMDMENDDSLNATESYYAAKAQSSREVVFSDLYLKSNNGGEVCISIMVPLLDPERIDVPPVGVVALRIHADHFLFPLIQSWPRQSETAEILLVRREGNDALFLNELRHMKGTALTLKRPLAQGDLPAARAIGGFEGAMQGIDYRGVPVFASTRHIPNSDWFLVAKIDKSEVYGPIHKQQRMVIVLASVTVLAIGFLFVVIWRRRFERFYRRTSDFCTTLVNERTTRLQEMIVERQKAEEQAVVERKRLYDVLETLPAYVILLTQDYHVAFDNHFFRTRFGNHEGRKCYEYLFNRKEPCENCETYKVFTNGGLPHNWEWTGPDGNTYDIYDYIFTDTDGSRLILEMGIDITARKEAERRNKISKDILALLSSSYTRREYLDEAVKHISEWSGCRCVGVRIKNKDLEIPYEARIGFDDDFWRSENHLSLEKDNCACMRVVRGQPDPQDAAAMTPGGSFRTDNVQKFLSTITEDEKKCFRGVCPMHGFLSLAIVPIRLKGEVVGAIHLADEKEGVVSPKMVEFLESIGTLVGEGIARLDMESKLRSADAYSRNLIESIVDPLVTIGPDGKITDVNEATEKATGLSRKELVGTDFSNYFTDPEKARDGYKQVFREGVVKDYELEMRHKDGRLTPVLYNATTYRYLADNLIGVIASARDISQRKRVEAELQKAQEEILNSKRLSDIGTLAATVAHELRNPLGVMQAALYNIKKKVKDDALDRHIANIEHKISDSGQIINNLLFYTRIKKPNYEQVAIDSLLDECEATVRDRFNGQAVNVVKKIDALRGVSLSVDPFQLKEVINNILINAYQAVKEGSGNIEIEGRIDGNEFVEVNIKDNGEGIDEAYLEKVFEPFFTQKSKGTGLGLAICRELVRLHNGEIDIKSKKGEGATVTVRLPAGGISQ